MKIRRPVAALMLAAGLSIASQAQAIPVLQLYVEGSTYDSATQTWTLTNSSSFRLWAIANMNGPGGSGGPVTDVRLSVAYPSIPGVAVSLTGTRIGGTGSYLGFSDPSTAPSATTSYGPAGCTHAAVVTDGSSPNKSDCTALPAHGVFGAGTYWQEFYLGNMSTPDSPVGDFISSFPAPIGSNVAVINAYDVQVSGLAEGDFVHFDLYDHYEAGNHTKVRFAPFSHDAGGSGAGGGGTALPEPALASLLGLGLLLLGFGRRKNHA